MLWEMQKQNMIAIYFIWGKKKKKPHSYKIKSSQLTEWELFPRERVRF